MKGSFYGGLVETGKHTALKMRSRKASGFKSLALYHCHVTQLARHTYSRKRKMIAGERRAGYLSKLPNKNGALCVPLI